jgi:hypothetical protein
MSKNENDRVLARKGARSVTDQELTAVSGGFSTRFCTLDPSTKGTDGDCD